MDLQRPQTVSVRVLVMMLSLGVLCCGVTIRPDTDLLKPLGTNGTFFCETDTRNLLSLSLMVQLNSMSDTYSANHVRSTERERFGYVNYIASNNISLTVLATEETNGTQVKCTAVLLTETQVTNFSSLIVQGAPQPPDPKILSVNLTTLVLHWQPPFTWEEYPITGYSITVLTDTNAISSSLTNATEFTYTRNELFSEDDQVCIELEFRVTASNDLDNSNEGVITGGYPMVLGPFSNSSLNETVTFDRDNNPILRLYFKLPTACKYQTATVTIDIVPAEPNQTAMMFGPYSYPYSTSSDTVSVTIQNTDLRANEEYYLTVNVDTGGGFVSSELFKFNTNQRADGELIIIVAVCSVVAALLLVAIVFMLLCICICLKKRPKNENDTPNQAPTCAAVTVTQSRAMVDNPIYEGGDEYESIDEYQKSYQQDHFVVSNGLITGSQGNLPPPPAPRREFSSSPRLETRCQKCLSMDGAQMMKDGMEEQDCYTMMNPVGTVNRTPAQQFSPNNEYIV